LAECQDLLLLHQPGSNLVLQNRFFACRSQAFAMHNPKATEVSAMTVFDESGERLSRFVCAQTVKIEFGPKRPMPPAQLSKGVGRNAISREGQALIAVEKGVRGEVRESAEFERFCLIG
jgi:hypothetical protein